MNLILYSGCYDIIHTDEQQHDIVFDSKTFASQCEVRIVFFYSFIVLLINANFATYYFPYHSAELMLMFAWPKLIFAIILLGSCEAILYMQKHFSFILENVHENHKQLYRMNILLK
jgi:hypothetical protein